MHLSNTGDENGFILISTLLIMVLLMLLGLAVTSSTITELNISSNDRDYKQNFYRAEGAAMETGQLLQNESDSEELRPNLTTQKWLKGQTTIYSNPSTWYMATTPNNNRISTLDSSKASVREAAISLGVADGASMSMTEATVHQYHLYGRSEERNSRVVIELGYRKKF